MNGAQLHLALNHLPVVTSFLTLLLLLWAWGGKSTDLKKASLLFVLLGAIFAISAYLTGEPAEGVLKSLSSFPKDMVHEHEEAAEFALIFSCCAALLALTSMCFAKSKQKISHYAFIGAIILTGLSCAVYLRTAHLGGLIKHEEIRPPSNQ